VTKKVLITGGNGFIAKSLHESLENSYTIDRCDRSKLDLLDSDKVFQYLKTSNFDIVIHGATYDAAPEFSTKDPNAVLENNLRMFFNLARCSDYFDKMIYFGSGAEFSRPHWTPRMSENYFGIHVPVDQYGYSKYLMNEYASLSSNIYNLRLFGLFGKYDDWRYRFISNACCKAVLDMPISMKHNSVFDYLYIDDLISTIDWAINNIPEHKNYNVCSGESISYMTLANLIIEESGKKLEIIVEQDDTGYEYSGDNSRLISETGLVFTDIRSAIRRLYGSYLHNKSIISKELFVY
jgi:UDP-glucose 4-epimerase